MSLSALGSNTSEVEVTNISSHGVWLLAHDHELFMPYADFPGLRSSLFGQFLMLRKWHPATFTGQTSM